MISWSDSHVVLGLCLVGHPRVVSLSCDLEVLALVELVLHLLLLELILRHDILTLRNPDLTLHHLLVWKLGLDQVHLWTKLSCLLQVLVVSIHAGFGATILEH